MGKTITTTLTQAGNKIIKKKETKFEAPMKLIGSVSGLQGELSGTIVVDPLAGKGLKDGSMVAFMTPNKKSTDVVQIGRIDKVCMERQPDGKMLKLAYYRTTGTWFQKYNKSLKPGARDVEHNVFINSKIAWDVRQRSHEQNETLRNIITSLIFVNKHPEYFFQPKGTRAFWIQGELRERFRNSTQIHNLPDFLCFLEKDTKQAAKSADSKHLQEVKEYIARYAKEWEYENKGEKYQMPSKQSILSMLKVYENALTANSAGDGAEELKEELLYDAYQRVCGM